MRSAGKLFYGDTHALRVRRKNLDGTIPDVTSDTNIVLVWKASTGETGELTGAVDAPGTDGTYIFADASTVLDPGKGKRVYIDGLLQWESGGDTYNANEKVRYELEKFP